MINAMTVDLEDWYHSIQSIPVQEWHRCESRVEEQTPKILKLFEQFRVKATFFVLGHVAEKHPRLVKEIHAFGHEVATHGYFHRLVYDQTPREFRADLRRSIQVLEDITGEKVVGYRAPYWTITKDSYWALDILLEEAIKYDSSIYPIKTYLYGIPDSPVYPYIIREHKGNKLIEFPPSTITICGLRLPIGGGFYMRVLPSWLIRRGIEKINVDGEPAIVYIHPPELDRAKPVVKLPFKENVLHYYNLGRIEGTLQLLLAEFKFTSLRELAGL
jgi:polysaccharide deacetylase family protein (PEP-CTERM system associated)